MSPFYVVGREKMVVVMATRVVSFFLSINEIVEMVAPASWKIFFAHLSSKVDCIIPQRGIWTGSKGHQERHNQRIIELTLLIRPSF